MMRGISICVIIFIVTKLAINYSRFSFHKDSSRMSLPRWLKWNDKSNSYVTQTCYYYEVIEFMNQINKELTGEGSAGN